MLPKNTAEFFRTPTVGIYIATKGESKCAEIFVK